jgi:DNA-directed RNA polymerase beta subunit
MCKSMFLARSSFSTQIAQDPDLKRTWTDLLHGGVVEYLDPLEEESAMILMDRSDLKKLSENYSNSYTHMEIHPSMILGICASIVPNPDHNQVRLFLFFLCLFFLDRTATY